MLMLMQMHILMSIPILMLILMTMLLLLLKATAAASTNLDVCLNIALDILTPCSPSFFEINGLWALFLSLDGHSKDCTKSKHYSMDVPDS